MGSCYAWSMQLMSVDWYFVTEKCLCTAFTILWARPTPNLMPVKLGVLRSLTSQCSLLHFSMGLEHVVQFGYVRLHFFNGVIGGSGSLQVLFFFSKQGPANHIFYPVCQAPIFLISPVHLERMIGASTGGVSDAVAPPHGCGTTRRWVRIQRSFSGANHVAQLMCRSRGGRWCLPHAGGGKPGPGGAQKKHHGEQGDRHEDDGALWPATSAAAGTHMYTGP